jgi:hypothetical protein
MNKKKKSFGFSSSDITKQELDWMLPILKENATKFTYDKWSHSDRYYINASGLPEKLSELLLFRNIK